MILNGEKEVKFVDCNHLNVGRVEVTVIAVRPDDEHSGRSWWPALT